MQIVENVTEVDNNLRGNSYHIPIIAIVKRILMVALRQVTTNNVCIVHRLMFIALVFFFVKYASENFQILEGVNSKFF